MVRISRTSKRTSSKTSKKTKGRQIRKKTKKTNKKHNGGNRKNEIIIIMMWMEGCYHCDRLHIPWSILKNEFKLFATFIDMESKSIDNELLKKYNIESPRGFPTLVKIKNDIVCEAPTSHDIEELRIWIKS